MNVDLLQNLMKQQNQTPNYIKKLRLNKNERETRDKKKEKEKVTYYYTKISNNKIVLF